MRRKYDQTHNMVLTETDQPALANQLKSKIEDDITSTGRFVSWTLARHLTVYTEPYSGKNLLILRSEAMSGELFVPVLLTFDLLFWTVELFLIQFKHTLVAGQAFSIILFSIYLGPISRIRKSLLLNSSMLAIMLFD